MPVDYHVWVKCWNAIRHTCTHQSWPTLSRWKTVLLTIWNDLPQEFINIEAILSEQTSIVCYFR